MEKECPICERPVEKKGLCEECRDDSLKAAPKMLELLMARKEEPMTKVLLMLASDKAGFKAVKYLKVGRRFACRRYTTGPWAQQQWIEAALMAMQYSKPVEIYCTHGYVAWMISPTGILGSTYQNNWKPMTWKGFLADLRGDRLPREESFKVTKEYIRDWENHDRST